jgi:trimethyllysine dioxygenase
VTHYGKFDLLYPLGKLLKWVGGFYDFTSDLSTKDTAYTSIALDVHTDNTYFSDPSGLQMLHLLSHIGEGGHSTLADGFEVAETLKHSWPEAFKILSQVRVPSHASGNDGISLMPVADRFPVIKPRHQPLNPTGWSVEQVRWNNSDRAAWNINEDPSKWYAAAREWVKLLNSEQFLLKFKLEPGRPLSKLLIFQLISS